MVKVAETTERMVLSLEVVSLMPSELVSLELRGVIWKTPILAARRERILRPPWLAICSARWRASLVAAASIWTLAPAVLGVDELNAVVLQFHALLDHAAGLLLQIHDPLHIGGLHPHRLAQPETDGLLALLVAVERPVGKGFEALDVDGGNLGVGDAPLTEERLHPGGVGFELLQRVGELVPLRGEAGGPSRLVGGDILIRGAGDVMTWESAMCSQARVTCAAEMMRPAERHKPSRMPPQPNRLPKFCVMFEKRLGMRLHADFAWNKRFSAPLYIYALA